MTTHVTTVLICDETPALRESLRQSISRLPGVSRVDAVARCEEVLGRWPAERHDLVLLGVGESGLGGVETVRRLIRLHPDANVVMLAAPRDRDAVAAAIGCGARGFLSNAVSREELSATVAAAMSKQAFAAVSVPQARRPETPAPELTEREQQVLTGMSAGKSNSQIGRDLFLSEDTIKTHARRLFRKLGVGDRAEAVASGFRHGFVR